MSVPDLDQFLQQQASVGGFEKLEERLGQVWDIAKHFGLDPFPTHFEIIPPDMMHEIGSTGLPVRFSHWTHGKAYRELKTRYDYGLYTIYEVVINSIPSQAFLLENNSDIENTVVMAHVLGHTDFFKHNHLFPRTRKDMPHSAAVSAKRIADYEYKYGREPVEKYLDAALAIAEHIDPFQWTRLSKEEQIAAWKAEHELREKPQKIPGEFDDLFDRPSVESSAKKKVSTVPIPLDPVKDIVGFIADFAPYLEDWQRDILDIVRAESIYFHPQGRTKIMNEGWAAYWHKRIMHEMSNKGLLTQEEDMRWVAMHAGLIRPSLMKLNPYYFGMNMFDFIEDYRNGNLTDEEKRWLEKEDLPVYPKYEGDYVGSPGQAAAREAMTLNDDQSFVRNYFNKIPSDRMKMFIYEGHENPHDKSVVSTIAARGWERIRDNLVTSMNNSGNPYLEVVGADYEGRQALYIKHLFEGQELDLSYLKRTMPYIRTLWGRPVHIETVVNSKATRFSFDANEVTSEVIK